MAGFNLGDVVAHLKLEMGEFTNSLNVAKNQIESTSGKFDGLTSAGNAVSSVGSALMKGVTLPIMAVGASAVKMTSDFQTSMSKVQALSGATGDDLKLLENTAKELGATTQYSATECADALGYMALAGWDAQQSAEGLPGVLNLASASQMGLAEASDMVTDYLTAFGESADQAGRMADVLAYAQGNSNTTTQQLGEAFKNCAVNANAFGLDIEQTTAILGKLADQGLKGSEAGTALNAVFRDISQKMDKGAIKIGETAVKVTNANGEFRNMADIVADVNKATEGMSNAQRMTALQTTFTADSIKAMGIMCNTGGDAIAQFTDDLYNAEGTAKQMSDTMNDNLAGDLKELSSAFEAVSIAIGEKVLPIFRPFVQGLTDLLSWFSKLPAPVMQFIIILGTLLASVGPVLLIIGKLMSNVKKMRETFLMLKELKLLTIINPIKSGFSGLLKIFTAVKTFIMSSLIPALSSLWTFLLANPIILVIAAIMALVAGFIYLWNHCEGFREFWINLWNTIKEWTLNAVNAICEFFTVTIPNAVQAFMDFLPQLPKWIAYQLGYAITKIIMFYVDAYSWLYKTGKDCITAIINWFLQLPGKIWKWLTDAFDKFVKWGEKMSDKAYESGKEAIDNVIKFFRELPGKLWDWLTTAFNNFIKWGEKMSTKASKAGKEAVDNIIEGFTGLPSKLWNIGVEAVKGLIGGIGSLGNTLWNKAKEIGNSFVNGVKSALNINSPSRRMRDEVGKMIPLGMMKGIDAMSGKLYAQARAIADNITDTLNLGNLSASIGVNTSGISTNNIIRDTSQTVLLRRLIDKMNQDKAIDYDKMADAFREGASQVNNPIYMDKTLVGYKTAPTVNKANQAVRDRLNRLEGVISSE